MSSRGKTPSAPAASAAAPSSGATAAATALPRPPAGKRPLTDHQLMQRRRLGGAKGSQRGIARPSLKRLARRSGIKHVTANVIGYLPLVIDMYLEKTLRDSALYMNHAKRHTISCLDVTTALKRQGRPIYGFGPTR